MNNRKRAIEKLIQNNYIKKTCYVMRKWFSENWAEIPLDVRIKAIKSREDGKFWEVLGRWYCEKQTPHKANN